MEEEKQQEQKEVSTTKKINGVNYEVVVKFSETSKETLQDKLVKLMVNDIKNGEI